jgi:hypothetical protein
MAPHLNIINTPYTADTYIQKTNSFRRLKCSKGNVVAEKVPVPVPIKLRLKKYCMTIVLMNTVQHTTW